MPAPSPEPDVLLDLENPSPGTTVPAHQLAGLRTALTVEVWLETADARAEGFQELVGQWTPLTTFDTFSGYDAGQTSGLDTTGFFGAVFDGRHIYFVPQHDRTTRHGKVLRYDTHRPFADPASWEGYDAGHTDGLNTKGYYGAVFDGRYVFFVPRRDAADFHSRVLRYDTRGGFTDPQSWSAYDAGLNRSYQSAAFDGRHIYFVPGHASVPKSSVTEPPNCLSPAVTGMNPDFYLVSNSLVLRHDTRSEFRDPASWQTFDVAGTDGLETGDYDGAVFDGRYVYFTPLSTGNVLRYDTHAEFGDHGSWSAYDIKPLGMELAVGALFDGRYVYFAPYGETTAVIRYDTQGGFRDPASWTAYEFGRTTGMTTRGFDGGLFDGRYVYFIPYYDGVGVFHGVTLRYDTTGGFDDPGAWTAHDAGRTDGLLTAGFNGGATDGRYLYCAPWNDGSAYPNAIVGNGRVLRYDTVGRQGSFSLRFADCGHNGGLCGAVPGARFIINTETGPRSVAANRVPRAGRQALAGVYDGRLLRLYQDGELVNEQAASGRLVTTGTELSVGQMFRGQGRFRGTIQRVRISRVARDARWLKAHAGATAR